MTDQGSSESEFVEDQLNSSSSDHDSDGKGHPLQFFKNPKTSEYARKAVSCMLDTLKSRLESLTTVYAKETYCKCTSSSTTTTSSSSNGDSDKDIDRNEEDSRLGTEKKVLTRMDALGGAFHSIREVTRQITTLIRRFQSKLRENRQQVTYIDEFEYDSAYGDCLYHVLHYLVEALLSLINQYAATWNLSSEPSSTSDDSDAEDTLAEEATEDLEIQKNSQDEGTPPDVNISEPPTVFQAAALNLLAEVFLESIQNIHIRIGNVRSQIVGENDLSQYDPHSAKQDSCSTLEDKSGPSGIKLSPLHQVPLHPQTDFLARFFLVSPNPNSPPKCSICGDDKVDQNISIEGSDKEILRSNAFEDQARSRSADTTNVTEHEVLYKSHVLKNTRFLEHEFMHNSGTVGGQSIAKFRRKNSDPQAGTGRKCKVCGPPSRRFKEWLDRGKSHVGWRHTMDDDSSSNHSNRSTPHTLTQGNGEAVFRYYTEKMVDSVLNSVEAMRVQNGVDATNDPNSTLEDQQTSKHYDNTKENDAVQRTSTCSVSSAAKSSQDVRNVEDSDVKFHSLMTCSMAMSSESSSKEFPSIISDDNCDPHEVLKERNSLEAKSIEIEDRIFEAVSHSIRGLLQKLQAESRDPSTEIDLTSLSNAFERVLGSFNASHIEEFDIEVQKEKVPAGP